MSIASDFIARDPYTRLLSIIARRLGHDCLVLTFGPQECEDKHSSAIFKHYDNYGIALLEIDGRPVSIKCVDAVGGFRSIEDMHHELCKWLYAVLENGGKLSDGKNEVDVSAVPEFMIECVLNGFC